jgi:hypothetical protein
LYLLAVSQVGRLIDAACYSYTDTTAFMLQETLALQDIINSLVARDEGFNTALGREQYGEHGFAAQRRLRIYDVDMMQVRAPRRVCC